MKLIEEIEAAAQRHIDMQPAEFADRDHSAASFIQWDWWPRIKQELELAAYWQEIAKSLEREITDNRKGLPSTHISPYDAR